MDCWQVLEKNYHPVRHAVRRSVHRIATGAKHVAVHHVAHPIYKMVCSKVGIAAIIAGLMVPPAIMAAPHIIPPASSVHTEMFPHSGEYQNVMYPPTSSDMTITPSNDPNSLVSSIIPIDNGNGNGNNNGNGDGGGNNSCGHHDCGKGGSNNNPPPTNPVPEPSAMLVFATSLFLFSMVMLGLRQRRL